jgi:hypothetical protein
MSNNYDFKEFKLERPTEESYLQAKQDLINYSNWLELCRAEQTKLIDQLSSQRETEKLYLEQIEYNKHLIIMYEAYKEVEAQYNE